MFPSYRERILYRSCEQDHRVVLFGFQSDENVYWGFLLGSSGVISGLIPNLQPAYGAEDTMCLVNWATRNSDRFIAIESSNVSQCSQASTVQSPRI